ncbi:MAG TPA: outer membrane beta-barrel protein [Longimicrobiales bacterium]
MSRTLFSALGLAAGLALVAAPAQAQYRPSSISVNRGQMEISGYAGYIFTSHFANGPASTSIGTGNGALYGAQLGLPLSPNASLVGGIGYSSADLRVNAPFIGGENVGTSVAWIYEGDLQLHGSKQARGTLQGFSPFLQVGAGAIHRNLTSLGISATSTDFAINGGVGVDFEVSQGLALRLMAKDYVGKASFNSGLATTNTLNNIALDAGVKLSF